MKTVRIFGRTVPIVAILLISILSIGAFGALLEKYATVTTTTTVEQSVLLDNEDSITEEVYAIGGNGYCTPHILENRAGCNAPVSFGWSATPDKEGIDVRYVKATGYSVEATTITYAPYRTNGYPADVVVEDLGDRIRWTFDMIGDKELQGDGHWGVAVIISFDGETPAFQVHNNDGATKEFPDGTWLYSAWGPTIDDGWNGWHTGEPGGNVPVDQLDWIVCEGDRCITDNSEGQFTITLDKGMLDETIYWAVHVGVGGFYEPWGGLSAYPVADPNNPTFDWVDIDYEEATIFEDVSTYILLPYEKLEFYIWYAFDVALEPDIYSITSDVLVN